MEFESECCHIWTIFANPTDLQTYLTRIWIHLLHRKAHIHHSLQSAISHAKVNQAQSEHKQALTDGWVRRYVIIAT